MTSDFITMEMANAIAFELPYPYRQIVSIAAGTGFRIDDLCHARVGDYNPSTKLMTLTEMKTGKTRSVEPTQTAMCDLLLLRLGKHDDAFLFPAWRGNGCVHRSTCWRWIHRVANRIAPGIQISPHSMRKSYAVYRRECGATLRDVQRDLGHENPATTMIYYYADQLTDAASAATPVQPA